VIIQSALIIAFFYLTTPIAGLMIARAAIMRGVPFWKKSLSSQESHVSQKNATKPSSKSTVFNGAEVLGQPP
jgi:phosphate/sulfate permease